MSQVNKLNIYLIKDGKTVEQIFKSGTSTIKKIQIGDGELYYNPKAVLVPAWVGKFFKAEFKDDNEKDIFNAAGSQAVLIKKVHYKQDKDIIFAISFGSGYHMLNKDAYVPNFGLKVVLNVISPDHIRKIDKHDISSTPKHTSEQLSKIGTQIDFNLNIETDILTGIVGSFRKDRKSQVKKKYKYRQNMFGVTLSGKSSLNINAPFDIDNIDKLLKYSYIAFMVKKYIKSGFDWVDNVNLINSETQLYKDLNNQLDIELKKLHEDNEKIWISVPELIEWNNISGFCYRNKYEDVYPDLFINDLLKYKLEEEILSTDLLKRLSIDARDPNKTKNQYSWTAFDCLYAEIDFNNKKYMLINSEWYEINQDFVNKIDAKFKKIIEKDLPIDFINAEEQDKEENDYNNRLSASFPNSVCLDAKNISHGGKYSKIEFCDVFDLNGNNLIHIKKYSGSSVLSHLFSQGAVSADLLLNDLNFRSKVEAKIKEAVENFCFKDNSTYNIIFGVIAKPQKDNLEFPFFSKVTLTNAVQKLQNMKGYDVYVKVIPNHAKHTKDSLENEDA